MSLLVKQQRIISKLEEKRLRGQNLHFLTGDAINSNDNYFYNLFYGCKSLDECLLLYYLKELTVENGGFDYLLHVVNSSNDVTYCYARTDDGWEIVENIHSIFSEKSHGGLYSDNRPREAVDSDAVKDEDAEKAAETAENVGNDLHQILLNLGEEIEKKEKRFLILLEGMEWIAELYNPQHNTEWIANLQKPEWMKAHNLMTVISIKDMELIKKYNFPGKPIYIGNPSAEEIRWAYLRYMLRHIPEEYQWDWSVLNNIANSMSVGEKSLVQCMRILRTVLQNNAEELKLENFTKAAELNIEEEVHWNDVILDEEVKRTISSIVDDFMKDDPKAAKIKGLILTGPPGTGKTMIAKALATEKKCYFMAPTLADLKGEYVGQSSKQIKRVFEKARGNEPTILFIDECDTVFPSRDDNRMDSYGLDMVNQFLQELDGATTGKQKIFTIAATNRVDAIDPAIKRRLGKTPIVIPLPDKDNRLRLFNIYLGKFTLDNKSFCEDVLRRSANMSGSDIKTFTDKLKNKFNVEKFADNEETKMAFDYVFDEVEIDAIERMKSKVFSEVLIPHGDNYLQFAEDNTYKLKDVIGYDDVKRRILRQVNYIKADRSLRKKYEDLHVDVPRGIIMYGPPGNAKSFMAQAVAGEADFYFFKVLSQDFASALPEQQLEKLDLIFEETLRFSKIMRAKGIILFFDEFDSLVGKTVLNPVVRGTLLNYLSDTNKTGLRSPDCKVVFMAATNYFYGIDQAMKRKGRLDEQLLFDNPTEENGKAMLYSFAQKDKHVHDIGECEAEQLYNCIKVEVKNDEVKRAETILSPDVQIKLSMGNKNAVNEALEAMRPSGADLRQLFGELKSIALEKNSLDSENRLLFTDEIYKERFPTFGK